MHEYENVYSNMIPDFDIDSLGDRRKILFVDIETTGLSRDRTTLYLIGAGFFCDDEFHTLQWFADKPSEENFILDDFFSFSEGFDTLIHYNGGRFDLPYIDHKAKLYGYDNPLKGFRSIDIYTLIKPFGKLLGLSSLKQRNVEDFLGIHSDDPYTGRDLIPVYYDMVREPSEELLKPLLFHNIEDLKGMLSILPILKYTKLTSADISFKNYRINEYSDLYGNKRTEILIESVLKASLPSDFRSLNEDIFISFSDDTLTVRIPVKECTLRHYFDNYRDYYYLPLEDTVILKSMASGVDRSRRERAKKDNCCIKKTASFIPVFGQGFGSTLFKSSLTSSPDYVIFDEALFKIKEVQETYIPALLKYLTEKS
ncbi:MAG: ribonuclease H-like domain-containing protein [Lachnospiraceae bacterium]|nr:ribonuclease H-like domain-containing protein [Lachnospiraceae bacterium]